MSIGPLLGKLNDRIARDKDDGDIAYFFALLSGLEYITKLVTAGIVACIGEDVDRHRYSLEYTLVRANSAGEWVDVLNKALTGPPAHCFISEAREITRELTERVTAGDWRYKAVHNLYEVAKSFEIDIQVGNKVSLRQLFHLGVSVRNRTRGHGAPTSAQCGQVCPLLADAIRLVIEQIKLFNLPWASLHRNLSGKYRVSPLLGDCENCLDFNELKKKRDETYPNGVFIELGGPKQVRFVFSDPDLRDILVPNGNFKSKSFEALSYITNEISRKDGTTWLNPPGRLPSSETEGLTVLEQVGNIFTNHPQMPIGHITRRSLESKLQEELLRTDRHRIVTLTGPGGIGKTTVAIAAIDAISRLDQSPYTVVLWMSARDIDLLESGPKPVAPRVVKKEDIAQAAVELLEPSEQSTDNSFIPESYFQKCLCDGAAGPTLFVFDNFETFINPLDVFTWIDTYIRPPNKVLITTRIREFVGDYAIEIGGMVEEEALSLIDQESERLSIAPLLNSDYKEELICESDGHPYVIKILLGQVAREQRAVKPKRIVASAEHLLTALFERTFESLSPAGKRVFLLLCSWRVFVPAVAVEAVSLRQGNERFDVATALDELRRFSLIDEIRPQDEDERFVGVPLAATSYGRRKLKTSPLKFAIEEDRKLLMEFGAGKREDAYHGVLPRIDRLIRTAATKANKNKDALEHYIPIIEYCAYRVPKAYLQLAELVLEIGGKEQASERAIEYLRRFLETSDTHQRMRVWQRIADLSHDANDVLSEIHALCEAALLPTGTLEEIGGLANRINNRIREFKERQVDESWSPEVQALIERVANTMEGHVQNLSATDCSRLSWLYLNIGMTDSARDIARRGLECEPHNYYCQNLVSKLDA